MAKLVPDAAHDAALLWRSDCDDVRACIGQPVDFADVAAKAAHGAVTPTWNALEDYAGGRQRTTTANNSITVTVAGTIDHVAHRKTGDSSLREVFSITPVAVLAGQIINIGGRTIQVADVS
jgi:hypothetical protein